MNSVQKSLYPISSSQARFSVQFLQPIDKRFSVMNIMEDVIGQRVAVHSLAVHWPLPGVPPTSLLVSSKAVQSKDSRTN